LDCSNTPLTSLPALPSWFQVLNCSNTPLILQKGESERISQYTTRWQVWRKEQLSK
jgi:hypothetical protein